MTIPGPLAHPSRRHALLLLWASVCTLGAQQLHAAEHITLRNGFELTCDHRGTSDLSTEAGAAESRTAGADSKTIRLYLDASDTNYLDVSLADILTAELIGASVIAAELPTVPAHSRAILGAPAAAHPDLTPSELRQLLATEGDEHHLDVDLLASVVQAESGSHTHAVSRVGAQGLMQLMPQTAAELGVRDSFQPEANVHGGTAYLDTLLKRYHDNLALALAAYNAGPAAVDRFHGVPPYRETRAYVARIIHEFNKRYTARQTAAALAMAR